MMQTHSVPVVLVFSGNDPSGGAGLQADLEALASHGCHAAPVVTALTVQNTRDIQSLNPVEPALVVDQARCVLQDIRVNAIKIGLIGSPETARALRDLLAEWPDIPVVLDPVLRSGEGTTLVNERGLAALNALLPTVTVLTPNSQEARVLSPGCTDLDACGFDLLRRDCEFVLITGTHENEPLVVNRLYGNGVLMERFSWERLPGSYHGSGCTLAASIAGLLAQAMEPLAAVYQAQAYTWQTLRHGYRIGHGQSLPNRLFWAHHEDD